VGTIGALVGKPDVVYSDRLNHACLIDGCRLSGAAVRVYPHNEADALHAMLRDDGGRFRRMLIVTDGVFGMDGDLAPLDRLAALTEEFGAMLLVDEAHGTGVFGDDGRGAASELGVADRVPIKVGTLSKALGSIGGFVAGSRRLIDWLTNHARTLIFSTAAPPAAVAAAREALRIVVDEPWRRQRVRAIGDLIRAGLIEAGYEVRPATGPIVPVVLGDPEVTVEASRRLRERGFLVPAIRPPTVPEGTSRLRISASAEHTDEQVAGLLLAFREVRA
jgi:8-amino-7-oxononanoate synthase